MQQGENMHATAESDLDPFGDDIVTEPRRIERSVQGVNDNALDGLVGAFNRLTGSPVPRLGQAGGAVLVVSPQAGYGKSHLLGRLFHRLVDKATLLYLRPYQDPSSCWISILEKAVAELNYPERLEMAAGRPQGSGLTQLDLLARQISTAVAAGALAGDGSGPKGPERGASVRAPVGGVVHPANGWDGALRSLERLLAAHNVSLRPNRRAWLKVLLAYANSGNDDDLRQCCLDWIAYRPLDPNEGGALGLRFADLPDTDMPYEARNERCFERFADLLALGSFYRPFVLAFDQTELYGASPALARSLGVVLSRLRREVPNHLAVVTANTHVWRTSVRPHFEVADAHALQPSLIELHGMNEAQATALIAARLEQSALVPEARRTFCASVVPELYGERVERSARDILRGARAEWHSQQGKPRPADAQGDLQAVFRGYQERLAATPRPFYFDSGVLQWAVQHVLAPAWGGDVEPVSSSRGHLSLRVRRGKETLLFGFESGNHWKRWDAVLDEAASYQSQSSSPEERIRVCYLRLPGQRPLPKRIQARFLALQGRVRLVHLSREQEVDLYAAHDFAADVQQDNHALEQAQVLGFLRKTLLPIAEHMCDATPGPYPGPEVLGDDVQQALPKATVRRAEPSSQTADDPLATSARGQETAVPEGLSEQVQAVVGQMRFVTLALLRGHLDQAHRTLDDAELLRSVQAVAWVKVHRSEKHTVLQWLP